MRLMDRKIIIAIDGYSSCGKSTLAKDLATRLEYKYIDTGAMYRAVTFYLLRQKVDIEDMAAVNEALKDIHITFEYDNETGRQITLLNGEHVEKEIRSLPVSDMVSPVSTIKEVRQCLVNIQKRLGMERGVVMDGRDIGTVVFPQAELKLFMTADEEVRVQRRFLELQELGMAMSLEQVRENLRKRDYIDSHRQESPLIQAHDALVLDNTCLNLQEQEDMVYKIAMQIIRGVTEEKA
jgi:cytidylate kinase